MAFTNLAVVCAVAAAVPLLLALLVALRPGLRVPEPVVLLVAGMALGPDGAGLVRVDATLATASVLGLAFLLFLAGLEIDLALFRGPVGAAAGLGAAASAVLALAVGAGLHAAGLADDGLFVAVALTATALGLVVPVLRDAGVARTRVGELTVAGASLGELVAIVSLSLLFGGMQGTPTDRAVMLGGVVALAVVVVLLGGRAAAWGPLVRVVGRLADTTAQVRVRLAVLLLVALVAAATRLGFEAILGAFLAGVALRALDPDGEMTHPHLKVKLDGIGFGFLVPVFLVTSGVQFDLRGVLSDPAALARIPVLLLGLLVVRGLPALLYRSVRPGLTLRETVAVGLLQATSLPFLVAATQIGRELGIVQPREAAALVLAGLVSVLAFPVIALPLLTSPSSPPEQGRSAPAAPSGRRPGQDRRRVR